MHIITFMVPLRVYNNFGYHFVTQLDTQFQCKHIITCNYKCYNKTISTLDANSEVCYNHSYSYCLQHKLYTS